jgi:flavin-dependent dehydrogenase
MSKKFDVIVVGAGPAGLLAARSAAEQGLSVALLEKKRDPAKLTRACGQTLISMNERFLNNYLNYNSRDKLVVFTDGFSLRYDGPYRNIVGVYNHAPNGHRLQLGIPSVQRAMGDAGRVAISFDKELLIRQNLEDCQAKQVAVFSGTPVEKVEYKASSVVLEGNGQTFEAQYVIAADGTNSNVARLAGFNDERAYYCNLYCLAYEISGFEPPEHDVIMRVAAWVNGVYSAQFVMPRFKDGDGIVALVSVDPRANLETAYEYFTTKAFCAPWYKNVKRSRRWAAGASCWQALENPYRNRVLVVGDGAATQELENSGAMITGWRAGHAVATALFENKIGRESKGISDYVKWWQSIYIHPVGITPEEYMKSFATPFMFSGDDDLNRFFGMINEPLPAVYNPFSSPTSAVMKKIAPLLASKYPDIVDKLKKRALPAVELFKPVGSITRPLTDD